MSTTNPLPWVPLACQHVAPWPLQWPQQHFVLRWRWMWKIHRAPCNYWVTWVDMVRDVGWNFVGGGYEGVFHIPFITSVISSLLKKSSLVLQFWYETVHSCIPIKLTNLLFWAMERSPDLDGFDVLRSCCRSLVKHFCAHFSISPSRKLKPDRNYIEGLVDGIEWLFASKCSFWGSSTEPPEALESKKLGRTIYLLPSQKPKAHLFQLVVWKHDASTHFQLS